MFEASISLMPFPLDAALARSQSSALQARVAQDGLDVVKQTALDDILTEDNQAPPSETGRLRALYRYAYTEAELRELIDRTFAQLGVGE